MGIISFNKIAEPSSMACGGTAKVSISLSAAPDILSNPADIVLLLDCSGSMAGTPLEQLKIAANKFIDILDEATDSDQNGELGGGTRIGIVSFARTATQETALITSVADLKAAVAGLTISGGTNHRAAFEKGVELLDFGNTSQKILIMFTDGESTSGGSAVPVTDAAKAQGAIIYCIGLKGIYGFDEEALRSWASTPTSSFVSVAPDEAALETLFENLAANITKAGATNLSMTEIVTDDFRITQILPPDKGTVQPLGERSLRWNIETLGATEIEGASLEFEIQHTGTMTGSLEVNESLLYSDNEGNTIVFPSPRIDVDCSLPVTGDTCPAPQSFVVEGCQEYVSYDLGDIWMCSSGRILEFSLTLKQVCPRQRIALGVLLKEVDLFGKSYTRGFRTLTVPAHQAASCRDLVVSPIRFVLPEDLNPNPFCGNECRKRRFTVQVFANAIDFPFDC